MTDRPSPEIPAGLREALDNLDAGEWVYLSARQPHWPEGGKYVGINTESLRAALASTEPVTREPSDE